MTNYQVEPQQKNTTDQLSSGTPADSTTDQPSSRTSADSIQDQPLEF